MARKIASVLTNAATVLAISFGAPTVTAWSDPADTAAACNPAPKPSAPPGSHGYYRIDHSAHRKCWYLASEDQKGRSASSRVISRTRPVSEPTSSPAMEQTNEPLPPAAELKPTDQVDRPAEQAGSKAFQVIPDGQSQSPPDSTEAEPARAPGQQEDAREQVQKSTSLNEVPAYPLPYGRGSMTL